MNDVEKKRTEVAGWKQNDDSDLRSQVLNKCVRMSSIHPKGLNPLNQRKKMKERLFKPSFVHVTLTHSLMFISGFYLR